jgi:hypothetical protein
MTNLSTPNPTVPELTPTDYLLADVARFGEAIPSGYQVALGIQLGRTVTAVEKLFGEHDLPGREELIAELTMWRGHVDNGLVYVQLMTRVVRHIKDKP